MARQLWFLRHGEAVPHAACLDADRALTHRGEQQSVTAGRALRTMGVAFAHVFTSPKVRARDGSPRQNRSNTNDDSPGLSPTP